MILAGIILIWGYLICFVAIPLLMVGWGLLMDFVGMIRCLFKDHPKALRGSDGNC